MYLQKIRKNIGKKKYFFWHLVSHWRRKSRTGSGCQWNGSADPFLYQNVKNLQHCQNFKYLELKFKIKTIFYLQSAHLYLKVNWKKRILADREPNYHIIHVTLMRWKNLPSTLQGKAPWACMRRRWAARLSLVNRLSAAWDGILGHQFNERLESFALCYSQSLLLAEV